VSGADTLLQAEPVREEQYDMHDGLVERDVGDHALRAVAAERHVCADAGPDGSVYEAEDGAAETLKPMSHAVLPVAFERFARQNGKQHRIPLQAEVISISVKKESVFYHTKTHSGVQEDFLFMVVFLCVVRAEKGSCLAVLKHCGLKLWQDFPFRCMITRNSIAWVMRGN
jgi:hypothetical protein